MYPGVYIAKKKDGTIYYRSSFTYKSKHISLGSFATEKEAHKASFSWFMAKKFIISSLLRIKFLLKSKRI